MLQGCWKRLIAEVRSWSRPDATWPDVLLVGTHLQQIRRRPLLILSTTIKLRLIFRWQILWWSDFAGLRLIGDFIAQIT